MRWILLADVHANLEALETVLEHALDWPDAQVVCAGDLVGYGPDPEGCVELLRRHQTRAVLGNHEAMILGRLDFDHCVHAGIRAALWSRNILSSGARAYLASLPTRLTLPPDLVVCHGSLDDLEHYVATQARADAALEQLAQTLAHRRILVCGHTHHPRLYWRGLPFTKPPADTAIGLPEHERVLINPGAVGQARDGLPLARYARYDGERREVTFHELRYAHERTCRKLSERGLVARVARGGESRVTRRVDQWLTRWAQLRFNLGF